MHTRLETDEVMSIMSVIGVNALEHYDPAIVLY